MWLPFEVVLGVHASGDAVLSGVDVMLAGVTFTGDEVALSDCEALLTNCEVTLAGGEVVHVLASFLVKVKISHNGTLTLIY